MTEERTRIRYVLRSGKEFERSWAGDRSDATEATHLVFEAFPDRAGAVEAFEVHLADRTIVIPSHSVDYVVVVGEDDSGASDAAR